MALMPDSSGQWPRVSLLRGPIPIAGDMVFLGSYKCETQDQQCYNTSVASVDSWLRDLAAHGESDAFLRATVGASNFINKLSTTLTAVLQYD